MKAFTCSKSGLVEILTFFSVMFSQPNSAGRWFCTVGLHMAVGVTVEITLKHSLFNINGCLFGLGSKYSPLFL